MNNWKKTTLGEISINNRGYYGIGASAIDYDINKFTYLRITDINDDGTLNKNGLKSVDEPNAADYLLKPNDIVFARTGNSTGRNYFYDGRDGSLVYAGFLIKFSIDPNKINPKYVKYFLMSDEYKGWVSSFNTGSTRGNINAQTYASLEIPLLPTDQQNLIADVLSALDDKIEINNKINENLEAQAQAIFKQWFVDFEFPDEEGKPYKSNGGKFIDSELGEIPEGWKVGTLGEFIHFIKGKKPKNIVEEKLEGYELYLTIDALTSSNSTYSEIEKNVQVNELDLLMVMDGASSGTIYFGKKGIVGSTLSKIELSDNNYKEIIYRCLKYYESEIKSHTTGSAIPHTDKNYVLQLPFIHPNKIMPCCNFFINIREQQIINQKENYRLSEIRDSLLPRLMSGEVRV